jgi:tetratricopeptide (TPR) repeat protein
LTDPLDRLPEALARLIVEAAPAAGRLRDIILRPAQLDEPDASHCAATAVIAFRRRKTLPADPAEAGQVLERVVLDVYRDRLSSDEWELLRAISLFIIPVPVRVMGLAGQHAGVEDLETASRRLHKFSLIDAARTTAARTTADGVTAANGMDGMVSAAARAMVAPLSDREAAALAKATVEALCDCWRDENGVHPYDRRSVEVARLALLGDGPAPLLSAAVVTAGRFLLAESKDAPGALDLVRHALTVLQHRHIAAGFDLLHLGALCARETGDGAMRDRFLRQGLAIPRLDPASRAWMLHDHAWCLVEAGDYTRAEGRVREAASAYEKLGNLEQLGLCKGMIADILRVRGQVDKSVRVRRKEQLPVYERLGSAARRAGCLVRIAETLMDANRLPDALRVMRDEALVLMQGPDARDERLRCLGMVADMLVTMGQTENAWRLHSGERLTLARAAGHPQAIAHSLYWSSFLRMRHGDLATGDAPAIIADIAESLRIGQECHDHQAVAAAGLLYGTALANTGALDAALAAFDVAIAAHEAQGCRDASEKVKAVQAAVRAHKESCAPGMGLKLSPDLPSQTAVG